MFRTILAALVGSLRAIWSLAGPAVTWSVVQRDIASELHALLQAAGEPPPFILVGHSFGGWIMRVFNHLFPSEVAGAVLVDPADVDEDERINAVLPQSVKDAERRRDQSFAAKVDGVWRPLRLAFGGRRFEMATGWGLEDESDRRVSAGLREEVFYLQHQRKSEQAVAREVAAFDASAAEVRASGTFGDRREVWTTLQRR